MVSLGGCDSNRTPMVSDTDDVAADFGRKALIAAVVELSKTPSSPKAFMVFTARVEELMPIFSREMKRDAELRTCVLAIGPLQANFDKPQQEQMQRLAVTVWPAILQIPTRTGEASSDYVQRLCENELASTCNNVVPEFWPVILNARVWRMLKSRVDVAYDRCDWCGKDPDFEGVLETSRALHLRVETLAKDAQITGKPSNWPTAGLHASPAKPSVALAFGQSGWVSVNNQQPRGGNWRDAMKAARQPGDRLSIHVSPSSSVATLLQVIMDAEAAGYEEIVLATRVGSFPYDTMEYALEGGARHFETLGVRGTDTVQVLVQALDYAASKKIPADAKKEGR